MSYGCGHNVYSHVQNIAFIVYLDTAHVKACPRGCILPMRQSWHAEGQDKKDNLIFIYLELRQRDHLWVLMNVTVVFDFPVP